MSKEGRIAVLAVVLLFTFSFSFSQVIRITTVTFPSEDSLQLTADEYIISSGNPYILLFHEQGSSRGEFMSIARRLCKMDYNCLAVDLRNGGNNNYISNETAKHCRETRCSTAPGDIESDMRAAIQYAHNRSGQEVVLFGSGANASLSLKLGGEDENVKGVVALSPGEYFLPDINIQDTISHIQKPVFVSSSQSEFPYVSQLVSGVDAQYVTLFEPQLGEGARGSVSLTVENETNSEYWLALLLFFKDLM